MYFGLKGWLDEVGGVMFSKIPVPPEQIVLYIIPSVTFRGLHWKGYI
jgi:hypothetical protein